MTDISTLSRIETIRNGDRNAKQAIAELPDLNEEEQLELFNQGSFLIYRMILNSDVIHPTVRHRILNEGNSSLVSALAVERPEEFTESEIIALLTRPATDKYHRSALLPLLSFSRLPESVLGTLYAADPTDALTLSALEHPDFPADVLNRVARTATSKKVMLAVVTNPKLRLDADCPLKLIERATKPYPSMHETLYRNDPSFEESFSNCQQAEDLLGYLFGRVKRDFYNTFSPDWEGSLNEFIEYSNMLDA